MPLPWKTTKYLGWPPTHGNPMVRVPRPDGTEEVIHVQRRPSEQDTYDECLRLRDYLGTQIWGKTQWERILSVRERSVARYRKQRKGPINGVFHYERPDGGNAWVASWHERDEHGSLKKRAKHHSYGKPRSQYPTSEQAMDAAIQLRIDKEREHYSVLGEPGKRIANKM